MMDGPQETQEGSVRPTENKFSIVSARETDSLGTLKWREYLNKDKLLGVWSTPDNSPFRPFQKVKTIEAVSQWGAELKPRYSEGERTSEVGIDNLIRSGVLGRDTAVILDSGGSHSVAMAVKLVVEQGYQPVVMFNADVHPEGANSSEQELATLLYFAQQMDKLKAAGKIRPDAPPVFILDKHRDDRVRDGDVNNTYTYDEQDFPTAQELRQYGIAKAVYLNEGDQEGRISSSYQSIDRVNEDLEPVVRAWEQEGVGMTYTGISPWKNDRNNVDLSAREPAYFERMLSYPDMKAEVDGEANVVAMHRNRERFIFTSEGELEVYNERGFVRDMKPEEIRDFKAAIEEQIDEQPDNRALQDLYARLKEQPLPPSKE